MNAKRIVILAALVVVCFGLSSSSFPGSLGGVKDDPSITKSEREAFCGTYGGTLIVRTPDADKPYEVNSTVAVSGITKGLVHTGSFVTNQFGGGGSPETRSVPAVFYRSGGDGAVVMKLDTWEFILVSGGIQSLEGGYILKRLKGGCATN